jgi:hypothetical protein
VDTEASKRTQNFGVDRKFRGTHTVSGGHIKLRHEHTALDRTKSFAVVTKFRGSYKVSEWTQGYGNRVSYEKEFANY